MPVVKWPFLYFPNVFKSRKYYRNDQRVALFREGYFTSHNTHTGYLCDRMWDQVTEVWYTRLIGQDRGWNFKRSYIPIWYRFGIGKQ